MCKFIVAVLWKVGLLCKNKVVVEGKELGQMGTD